MDAIDRLDPDKITANLKIKLIGRSVVVFESTSSTNDIAAEYAKNIDNDGLVIFSENQTSGRGRGDNKWVSGACESLLCSVVLTHSRVEGELLSLAVAVAAAETIGTTARIKWPNDILIDNKKIAGILLERKGDSYIVGIGINCHQNSEAFTAELTGRATSIDIQTRTQCDRPTVARRLISSLDHWYEIAQNSAVEVIEHWKNLSIQLGHRVIMQYDGQKISGNCIGVDPQKGLILQLDGGAVRMFKAGHSSLVS